MPTPSTPPDTGADPRAGDPVDAVGRSLIAVVRGLKGMHADVMAELGVRLELPALGLLGTAEEHAGQRLSRLAEVLRLDLSVVSRQVAQLEREGLLRRERDPLDHRASLVHPTPAGTALLQRVRDARAARLRTLLADWSDEDLDALARGMARLAADTTPDTTSATPAPAPTAARPDAGLALAGQETR